MRNFLKTYELSSSIVKMISETKSYCYIVSPYVKIWPQLDRVLSIASSNNAYLTFIIREDSKAKQLVQKLNEEYGFEIYVIKDLHIKLYLNESNCIISSMNLYDTSQHNNLEIGYEIGNSYEVKEEVIEGYILKDKSVVKYAGKFEQERKALLGEINKVKAVFHQSGYCISCKTSMDSDFNPYNPKIVRCKECYFKADDRFDLELKTSYCHYCGRTHSSTVNNPFHKDCLQTLKDYRKKIRDYR
jgi:hypothetical protein